MLITLKSKSIVNNLPIRYNNNLYIFLVIYNYKIYYYNIKVFNIKKLNYYQLYKICFFKLEFKLDFLPNF